MESTCPTFQKAKNKNPNTTEQGHSWGTFAPKHGSMKQLPTARSDTRTLITLACKRLSAREPATTSISKAGIGCPRSCKQMKPKKQNKKKTKKAYSGHILLYINTMKTKKNKVY